MLIAFNKPFGVLSQFTGADGHPGLASYLQVPAVYPAGRLDRDSEGLLLLTDEGPLQHRISSPRHKLAKTYWVQVEGAVDELALAHLARGVQLKDGPARPVALRLLGQEPEGLWARQPPVRFRKQIPTHWIELVIDEGRNRQVRRMTAAVGLPTLRLVRVAVGPWRLGELQPGQWRELDASLLPIPRRARGPGRRSRLPGGQSGG